MHFLALNIHLFSWMLVKFSDSLCLAFFMVSVIFFTPVCCWMQVLLCLSHKVIPSNICSYLYLANASVYTMLVLSFHFHFLSICSFGLIILPAVYGTRDAVRPYMSALLDNRNCVLQPNLLSNSGVALPATKCNASQYLLHFAYRQIQAPV